MTLNLTAPTSWSELTQEQLEYLLKVIASVNRSCLGRAFRSREDFNAQVAAQVAVRCLFHWNGVRVVTPYADAWLLNHGGIEFLVSSGDLAAATAMLSWVSSLPEDPVRFDTIDGASAVSADIEEDLSFDDYLACEACWQVWQTSQDDNLLREMAAVLYRKSDIKLREHELLSIFYWWAGLKSMLSRRYPNFFQASPVDSGVPHVDELTLRRSMDSQIRALTKGDITKESTILSMPAIRAITELDALAREYEELKRKYTKK
jgi:hypothetical protein